METAREYPSITRHFAGTSDSQHPAGAHGSLQSMVWQSPNKQKYTIEGEQIDQRLSGLKIDVKIAEIDFYGQQTKVAVTCFENPSEGIEVQRADNFPACRKPIVNRVFILRADYDEADITEAIQDEIAREEAARKAA